MQSSLLKFVLIVFCFSVTSVLNALDDQSKAFYAISSLKYHLDSQITNNDLLTFSESDIEELWHSASMCSLPSNVMKAKEYYYRALKFDSNHAKQYFVRSHKFLNSAWERLNPCWQTTDPIIEKNKNDLSYLLPEDSSLRPVLDALFADPDVLDTPETFAKRGFITISMRPSGMAVAKHPHLKGYLVKAYIRSKKIKPNWLWCVHRCWGAKNIRELLKEKNIVNYTIPDKWIYQLSHSENLVEDLTHMTSTTVLVVTDMQLVEKTNSRHAWKTLPTYRHIQELYCILSHGYSSCSLPSNIPYTIYGTFSCIDTEHPQRRLPYDHVGRHLSEKMADYWNYLVRTGGRGMPF